MAGLHQDGGIGQGGFIQHDTHFGLTLSVGDGLGVNRSLGGSREPRSKLHSWYLGTVARDGEAHDHGVVLIDRARVNPTEGQNRFAVSLDRQSGFSIGRHSAGLLGSSERRAAEELLQTAGANRLDDAFVLGLEQVVHALVREARLGELIGIRGGMLTDAAAADEDLRLQKLVVSAGFALHVVHRALVLDIGIESKNHLFKSLRSKPLAILPRDNISEAIQPRGSAATRASPLFTTISQVAPLQIAH